MPPEWRGLLARPIAVVAAHPDDETIGLGALLPGMPRAHIMHVTNGAPRDPADARAAGFATTEAYARARRKELLAAMHLAGVEPERTCEAGFTDQEVSLHLAELARRLAGWFAELSAAAVFTHPYEGGHPDHDAAALAVHAACRLAPGRPAAIEFTSYHDRGGSMETGVFLAGGTAVTEMPLSAEARAFKRKLFDCFLSQRHMLDNFPIGVERFRPAPEYDFTAPPHAGILFYERFDWGMTGERFRALAHAALQALGLGNHL